VSLLFHRLVTVRGDWGRRARTQSSATQLREPTQSQIRNNNLSALRNLLETGIFPSQQPRQRETLDRKHTNLFQNEMEMSTTPLQN